MSYSDANRAIEDYVTAIFKTHPSKNLLYHNLRHTQKVAGYASEIALFYKMNDESLFIIRSAAWFHDTGYLFTGPKAHEEESVRIMKEFISNFNVSEMVIDKIQRCIMVTRRVTVPVSLSEEIMCDADTYHFGTLEFRQTDPLIKKEIELLTGTESKDWLSTTIHMLRNHRFYTSYCQEKLNVGKSQNMLWLQSMLL
jgi:predicted metal-dependent HD superfamily phosphohydrolase